MTTATPIFFGPADRPLFGWVHQPEGRMSRGTAVLCPPLHREYISAHYSLRVLAEQLAERDITAIRFDYAGTGDSAGSGADPGHMEASEASIDHALRLAEDLGTTELVLVGMRMGALLAARAAARSPRVAALVLWDPCASGREFVREQIALFRLTYGKAKTVHDGTEVAGFVLSAETVEHLGTLVAPDANPTVERALLLTRPDRSRAGSFGVEESRVEDAVAEGQAELMDIEPFLSTLPASIGTIAGWLERVLPHERRAQKAPDGRDEVVLEGAPGAPVTERLVHIGADRLFGVVTTGAADPVGPWIVFLTSGNESHVGPNRMWVDLARRWAGLGLPCLRLDLSGMGDSPPRPGRPGHVERAPEAFQDVQDAVEQLARGAAAPPQVAPVVLVGLCSGAYQALDSAIDLRTQGAIAINPVLRFPPPEAGAGRVDPRRTLCRPIDESLRSAYRRLPNWKLVHLARQAYIAVGRLQARQKTAVRSLREMSAHGTDVLCICGRLEADALFEGSNVPTQPRVELAPRAHVEVIEGLDHGLIPEHHRRQVADLMTRHLVSHYGGEQGGEQGPGPFVAEAPADLVP